MARESRFQVTFAADGASVTIVSGTHPPEAITLASMPSDAREHCFRFGFATYVRNAVAGAEKNGWTDAQCHSYMARKAKALVAGQFKISDGAADFHDLVTAVLQAKKLTDADRGRIETALLAATQARRDEIKSGLRAEIAAARAARVAAEVAAMGNAPQSDLLSDL